MTMTLATPLRHPNDSPLHSPCRPPSHRLSRSPKRAKSTPSPNDLLSDRCLSTSSSSSSSRSIRSGKKPHRRPVVERRGVSFERYNTMSPWRSEDGHERRREMTVPLLSQTLSSFSLSHSPDVDTLCTLPSNVSHHTPTTIPFHIPSPSSGSHLSNTPRRPPSLIPLRTPLHDPLPRDHIYPSTAPLPQIPSFLGSPFSSKTARGRYNYHSMSPSKGVMTENLGYEGFDLSAYDWIDRSEWMVEEILARESPERNFSSHNRQPQSSRLRRDTSGSTSSMEEFSGSAASSASLFSLARSSGEHQTRPNMVSIWGEQAGSGLDEEATNSETPSRQPFIASEDLAEGHLNLSSESYSSPGLSPLVGRTGSGKKSISERVSPLQAFLMARTPSGRSLNGDHTPSLSKSKSAFSTFLPRLLSSKKSAKKVSLGLAEQTNAEESSTDSDEKLAHCLGSSTSSIGSHGFRDQPVGLGIGISHASSTGKAQFERSVSSGSSTDIDPSPSKNLPDISTASQEFPASPLGPSNGVSLMSRRKTLATQPKKPPTTAAKSRPFRPMLRRGITEPKANGTPRSDSLTPAMADMSTPVAALFGDVRPSPAAFASTGLVKKKSIIPGLEIPKFGESEPKKRTTTTSPVKPIRSRLAMMATVATDLTGGSDDNSQHSSRSKISGANTTRSNTTSDASVSVYVRAAQKTRGLRRKTSSMFAANGSIGSLADIQGDPTTSPLTPTKPGPGLRITPFGLDVTTPSPTTPTNMTYPFAPSTSLSALSSPPYKENLTVVRGKATEVSFPVERASLSVRPNLLRNAPVARSSNPMLAASFRAQAGAASRLKNGQPGSRLDREFVIVQSLGKGEFSQVWKVKEKSSGKLFAVKAGKPYTGYKNRLRQLEEVSILHQLSLNPHPHILNLVDSWEHASRLYIRTELAVCGDLSMFLLSLGDVGGMGETRVWKVLSELSSGLEYIHENNFIHLDLKPSNILITNLGSLKIADFGMSTIMTDQGTIGGVSPALPEAVDDGGFVWNEENSGAMVPSPILDREVEGDREYLCPEALGDGVIGKEADVYSLGIMILEAALNVVLPSNGDGWVKLRNDDFSDLEEHYLSRGATNAKASKAVQNEGEQVDVLPEVSDLLLDVIKRMMVSEPLKRMSLGAIRELGPIVRIEQLKKDEEVEAALVEESAECLERILW